jgi:hypothetical protein
MAALRRKIVLPPPKKPKKRAAYVSWAVCLIVLLFDSNLINYIMDPNKFA